ncbi:MAG: response regulator [Candidatus Edwardsbacteria bacterium]
MPEIKAKILWVDDEIDLLRSHILFLQEKGYQIIAVSNGEDAVSSVKNEPFDLVLLDEMMPGKDGLSTLREIKQFSPHLSCVMVTKSEREDLMNEAFGQRIDDYLVKPLNPNQILSTCKRLLERRELVRQQALQRYVSELQEIRESRSLRNPDWKGWIEIYCRLTEWDLLLDEVNEPNLKVSQEDEKRECNLEFARYVSVNYPDWVKSEGPSSESQDRPVLSADLVKKYLVPLLNRSKHKVYFLVMDCMRLDQWLLLEPLLEEFYEIKREYYYSIIPTATPYARNAIFSGLFPVEILKAYPQYWRGERNEEEGSGNRFEHQLLDEQLERLQIRIPETKYVKIFNLLEASEVKKKILSHYQSPLVSLVVNFLDILIHSRSESEIFKEMLQEESGFRALTASWFVHSDLYEILKKISTTNCTVVLTSDHGSIFGKRATVVRGGKDTSLNLRYKFGTTISGDPRHLLFIKDPEAFGLPADGLGKHYIIAQEDFYFVYPTKFAEYSKRYQGMLQHGGISLEEMIVPIAIMEPRR